MTAGDTVRLGDMFDVTLLGKHVEDGNVRRQEHPELPLVILNYTAQAQWSQTWDEVTMACRGLIVDNQGIVVARPFGKFFNRTWTPAGRIFSKDTA